MRVLTTLLMSLLIALAWVAPASAMTCRDWTRLGPGAKSDAIHQMIADAVAGQGGRSLGVNRGAIERCMMSRVRDIEYDFDDTCADSSKASMQALNNLFKHHLWNCAR